jgi:hypothetical protein
VRRVFSGGKHPDLREHVSLRGATVGRGSWSAQVRNEGSLQPFVRLRVGDHRMLEQLRRRGTSSRLIMRSHARRGGSFAPSGSTRVSSSSSFQPVIGATGNGFVASPASGVPKSGGLQRFDLCALAAPGGNALVGLAWLAARSSRKGWATSMPSCPFGSSAGSEGNAGGARLQNGRAFRRARIGRSRVVLARRCR